MNQFRHHGGMVTLIGHTTAMRYWLRTSARPPARLSDLRAVPADAEPHVDAERAAALAAMGFEPGTDGRYDVLVSSPAARRRSPFGHGHALAGHVPAGSFAPVADDVLVATPAFSFLLAAGVVGFEELLMFGCDLCAQMVSGHHRGPYVDRPPLTTPAALRAFSRAARSDRTRCSALAERAAGRVLADARSHMESACGLALSLPTAMGGFGLSGMCLNAPVSVPRRLRRRLRRDVITPDFCWPSSRVAAEYNSRSEHGTAEQADEDQCRLDDLFELGWKARALRMKQATDFWRFDRFARIVGSDLGIRVRCRTNAVATRRLNAHLKLMDCALRGWSF